MSNEKEDGASIGLGCLLMLVSIVATAFVRAWATVTLWGWFVVPVAALAGAVVAPLPGLLAYGLFLFIASVTNYPEFKDTKMKGSVIDAGITVFSRLVLTPVFLVLFGWIARVIFL
jgi:hypothetical protein